MFVLCPIIGIKHPPVDVMLVTHISPVPDTGVQLSYWREVYSELTSVSHRVCRRNEGLHLNLPVSHTGSVDGMRVYT